MSTPVRKCLTVVTELGADDQHPPIQIGQPSPFGGVVTAMSMYDEMTALEIIDHHHNSLVEAAYAAMKAHPNNFEDMCKHFAKHTSTD